jgi:hypothetical protein
MHPKGRWVRNRTGNTIPQPKEYAMKFLMKEKLAFAVCATATICAATTTFAAAEYGTAPEAKAMLEKVEAALRANKSDALAKMQKGESGFKDRDLYPFCATSSDGIFTAHPSLMGRNMKELKDKTGKPLGEEMLAQAAENKIQEISYMWPRPGATEPVQKVTYFTKVGDQVCGVGYYK